MLGPLPVPGSLDVKNVQVAPLAGTWQTLHGPVSGTFLYLKAVEELTSVKLLLNIRHFKFEISFSPLIILIRHKINLPKVIQLRRGSGWVKALACLSRALLVSIIGDPGTLLPTLGSRDSWRPSNVLPGPVRLFPPLKGLSFARVSDFGLEQCARWWGDTCQP